MRKRRARANALRALKPRFQRRASSKIYLWRAAADGGDEGAASNRLRLRFASG
jgi:hypothetical protein